jgi:hypothetical protein
MNRMTIGLAACLAAVTAGCGTVTASQQGAGGHTAVPSTTGRTSQTPGTASHGPASARPASTGPAGYGLSAGCPGGVSPQGLVITLAGNGKTYCVRVGEKLDVYLHGTVASMWLEPLASSNVLRPIPNGARSLVQGLTGASFAAARPGQVLITSVRPPCQFGIAQWKQGGIEPAFPLPKTYPLRSCSPQRRFSTTIIVVRLGPPARGRTVSAEPQVGFSIVRWCAFMRFSGA